MAVPTPVAANRRPATTIRSRTREPRYAPSPNRNASVRTAPVTVAGQKPITRNGTTGIKAAIMGATPWTPALTRAAARNADRCSSLSSTSIARSMLWRCGFFSPPSPRHDWGPAILHARAQGGEHLASRSLQGLVQGLDLRARALREVRLPPAFPPEHREGRLDHGAGGHPAGPP